MQEHVSEPLLHVSIVHLPHAGCVPPTVRKLLYGRPLVTRATLLLNYCKFRSFPLFGWWCRCLLVFRDTIEYRRRRRARRCIQSVTRTRLLARLLQRGRERGVTSKLFLARTCSRPCPSVVGWQQGAWLTVSWGAMLGRWRRGLLGGVFYDRRWCCRKRLGLHKTDLGGFEVVLD